MNRQSYCAWVSTALTHNSAGLSAMAAISRYLLPLMLNTSESKEPGSGQARPSGRGYQTLINEALRKGLQADAIKEMLRQVIREELVRGSVGVRLHP